MKTPHLSDDRLVEIGMTETASASEQQHLGSCAACEARRAGIAHTLEELSVAAHEDADAVFSAERLARQQVKILQRIEEEARPAKVIAFPAAPEPSFAAMTRRRPATRWIAAAAVAGLVVGVAAGRLGQQARALGGPDRVTLRSATPAAPQAAIRNASVGISDDELLGQIERAAEGRGGASLRPLDEMTPRAWDVR